MKREKILLSSALVCILATVFLILLLPQRGETDFLRFSLPRLTAGVAFVLLALWLALPIGRLRPQEGWLCALLAFAVALYNLPLLPLLAGDAHLTQTALIPLFLLSCFATALFEEALFRGVLFLGFWRRLTGRRGAGWYAILLSSVCFALLHFANLAQGASVLGTLRQVGYSFLIGGMCAVVLAATHSLALCVLIHTVYNFCGTLVPTLGEGSLWNTARVLTTAALGAIALVYYLVLFAKTAENDDFEAEQRGNR